jgi:hypothetical protein
MALSVQSVENLLDLVEIKLGAMEVYGECDLQDIEVLEATRCELIAQLDDRMAVRNSVNVVPLNSHYCAAAHSPA